MEKHQTTIKEIAQALSVSISTVSRALQDDPQLKKENYVLRQISKILSQAMKEGELQWNNDFDDFKGNLTFDDNED